ncbi:MAG TPA: M24 family metallopeptidase [Alphaproteobacteria bacterium]|nr:M24 family metallopeptidase [Alphaproteobacteria bacterium]
MDQRTFQARVAHTRDRLLRPLDLDMLLCYADDISAAGAVRYLTDFDVYAMYALAIVPRRGDVALAFGLHHSAYLVRVKQSATADYLSGTYAPGALCRQLLQDAGTDRAPRVGIVGGANMFRRIAGDLHKALDGATYVEIDQEAWHKAIAPLGEPLVRDALDRSAAIARDAVAAVADDLAPTRSAADLAAIAALTARRRGADLMNREIVEIRASAGPVLADRLGPPGRNPIGAGGGIAVEIALRYRGLRAYCGRTFGLDEAWSTDLDRAAALHQRVIALAKPGRTGGEFARDAARLYAEAGATGAGDFGFGHGVGFQDREPPVLRAGSEDELQPGTALVIRSRIGSAACGAVFLADTVMMGEHGPTVLTAAQSTIASQ